MSTADFVITLGEPAGIGPDCVIRAWATQPAALDGCIIAAPADWLRQRTTQIGIELPIQEFNSLSSASAAGQTDGIRCWNPVSALPAAQVTAAQPSARTASAVVACIEAAAKACLRDEAAALITGPIEKAVLRSSGFNFPGHTEFLAHLSARHCHTEATQQHEPAQHDFVMMLASEHLRVALLTTHMALRDVPDALNTADTVRCLRIVHADLHKRFSINTPKLALCALNPHAGEQGHFGCEEIDILAPAVAEARAAGITVSDPLPADTVFSAAVRQQYDAIVCCYHDQALIPLKTLSFGEAVNVTLGLPFIRTSVDHGTALDRVGCDDVSCTSLLAAITMARQMSQGA